MGGSIPQCLSTQERELGETLGGKYQENHKKHLRDEYVQNSDSIAVTQYGSHDYSYYGDDVDSAICHCSELCAAVPTSVKEGGYHQTIAKVGGLQH